MNKTISRYLSKNISYPALIESLPHNDLGIIVVIPSYDEPDINSSILAIANCIPPKCSVEIIISINAGKSDLSDIKERNLKCKDDILELKSKMPKWVNAIPILHNDLPDKKAGVGLGRKIGMDEAVRRFAQLAQYRGIIVCFDADSKCESNYLVEIENHFKDISIESASINYEHPIEGVEYLQSIYDSIIQYELHLRYFIRIQKKINLPYAFHTVGSSMACTVAAYCAVGGMNQRKAGEDFYFIHKLVKFGKHSELNSTKVIPSPRISDRVPFGTGRAIGTMQELNETTYNTYDPQSFNDLSILVEKLPDIYNSKNLQHDLPEGVKQFLILSNGKEELERILKNTSDYLSFSKMFWHWFDAFLLMKYLHFMRDNHYPDIQVLRAVNFIEDNSFDSGREALIYYREHDLFD
jgi:hypothetical protein